MSSSSTANRPSHRLLTDRNYGPYFAGWGLSSVGMWIHNISAAIVVFQLTRSALLVGFVSVAQFGPQLLLTLWSGARADRTDRQRQMILGWVIAASGSGCVFVWIAVFDVGGTAGATGIILGGLLSGIGFALGIPAMHSFLPALVRPSELPTVVALHSVPMTLARATGPALGAFVVTTLGPAPAFAIATGLHLSYAGIVSVITGRATERAAKRDTRIRVVLDYVRSEKATLALLFGVATIGFGADPIITLTPVIAEELGGDAQLVGGLAAAWGTGSAAAFVGLRRIRERIGLGALSASGLALIGTSLLAVAASSTTSFVLAFLFLGGVGMTYALTAQTTLLQQRVPDVLRGRIMALWSLAFLGSRPLAAAMNGAIADAASSGAALTTVGTFALLGAIVVRRATRVP